MTHLVALGKNTLCESEQIPFSVCGRSFYCRQQQDVVFLTIVLQSMQKNAGEKPLRWLGKTNSRSKNSTPTGRCQAETDKFTGAKFFRCGKRFASSMPQGEAPITKSFSKSQKMTKLLDRGDGRAYYFGRRTAEKRLFIEQKVSFT